MNDWLRYTKHSRQYLRLEKMTEHCEHTRWNKLKTAVWEHHIKYVWLSCFMSGWITFSLRFSWFTFFWGVVVVLWLCLGYVTQASGWVMTNVFSFMFVWVICWCATFYIRRTCLLENISPPAFHTRVSVSICRDVMWFSFHLRPILS